MSQPAPLGSASDHHGLEQVSIINWNCCPSSIGFGVHFHRNTHYKLIEGDYEVVEGVQVLFTPGHTPGHQSILIKTEKPGPILLTGDAAYLQENLNNFIINKIASYPS